MGPPAPGRAARTLLTIAVVALALAFSIAVLVGTYFATNPVPGELALATRR